jgi:8-oxo-dGTP diphosphatase
LIDKVAWIRLEAGHVLSTRSRGKDVYYLPGGKREPGESDVEVLAREIREELCVAIAPESATRLGTFEAQAHGHAAGVIVRMTCYAADYTGRSLPAVRSTRFAGSATRIGSACRRSTSSSSTIYTALVSSPDEKPSPRAGR